MKFHLSPSHCGLISALLLMSASLSSQVIQAEKLKVRRSTAAISDSPTSQQLDQDFKRLFSKTSPNTSERENLESLFRVINDTKGLGESGRRHAYALAEPSRASNDSHQEQIEYRKVAIEDTISQGSASQEASTGMDLSFEGNSLSEPHIHWKVMFNDTTILVVRGANKYYYWKNAQAIIAFVIFAFIVFGNLSILYRLKSHRRRRSNVNYFIVQLAIADLLVGIFNVTLDSVMRLQTTFTWGLLACRASKYISSLFIYSSTYLLVALSVDRWEAVVKPLAFTRNRSRGYQLVTCSWLLAVFSALPVAYFSTVKEVEGIQQCWIDLDKIGWRVYLIYLTSLILVIPTMIIAICYAHIVYTIWSKARLVSEQQRQRSQQQAQQFKEIDDGPSTHDASKRAVAPDQARRICLKSKFDGADFKRSCTFDTGQDKRAADEPTNSNGQIRTVLSERNSERKGAAARTKVEAEELTQKVEFNLVVGRDERPPSDTLDVNNNALATLTSSASSTSSRSSSSSSTSRATSSHVSPLEVVANDLAGATSRPKVAATPAEPSVVGVAHLNTLLTRAPDATIYSDQRGASRKEEAGVELCQDGKQSNQGRPTEAESEDTQRRSSRRALSEDLGGAKSVASLANAGGRSTCLRGALMKRSYGRRSSHMVGGLQMTSPAHNGSQQSNSMISCDSLTVSSAMTKIARKSLKKLTAGKNDKSAPGGRGEFVAQQHGSGVIPKARIKTIKMTLVIVIAYILCWTPFLIVNLLHVFDVIQNSTNVMLAIMTMTQSLAHLNSAVNPIIFWLFSSKRHASDTKAATTNLGNGQSHSQNKPGPKGGNARIGSKATRLVGLLRTCWAQLRWILTCFNLCGLSAAGPAVQRCPATDSRMFDRTTTTTNYSQASTRHQQQRSGWAA